MQIEYKPGTEQQKGRRRTAPTGLYAPPNSTNSLPDAPNTVPGVTNAILGVTNATPRIQYTTPGVTNIIASITNTIPGVFLGIRSSLLCVWNTFPCMRTTPENILTAFLTVRSTMPDIRSTLFARQTIGTTQRRRIFVLRYGPGALRSTPTGLSTSRPTKPGGNPAVWPFGEPPLTARVLFSVAHRPVCSYLSGRKTVLQKNTGHE